MRLHLHTSARRRAVTLTEIVVVIAIITTLTGLSFVAFSAALKFADKLEDDVASSVNNVRKHAGNTLPASAAKVKATSAAPPRVDRVPGQYIVTLKTMGPNIPQEAQRLAALVDGTLLRVYTVAVPGFAIACDSGKIGLLQSDAAVSAVDQDRYVYPCAAAHTPINIKRVYCNTDNTGIVGIKNGNVIPTSVFRLVRDLANSNHIITGRRNLGNLYDYAGALSTVAILDTGIDRTHPDLFVVDSVDFTGSNNLQDLDGHGTHIAGVVGARNSLATGGVMGVYPNAPLISLKVMTKNTNIITGGTGANVYAALEYVINNAPTIRVCLMAFQTFNVDPFMNGLVDAAANKGVLMVAAAGENNPAGDARTVSPGSAMQAITVGAMVDYDGFAWSLAGIGIDDTFSGNSNYGTRLDFVAPGGGAGSPFIQSTIPIAGQIKNGLSAPYASTIFGTPGQGANGTSFSAAHVAGMLAFVTDPQTSIGYVFPHGITTYRPLITNRVGAINALYRLTHRAGWHNDVVNDGHGNTIPVANFYVNQFLP
jgi:hypothetical protein